MGRTLLYDKATTAALIAQQNGLITRAQALSCGLTKQALRVRLREDGPWQVLVPGVYATFTGAVTPEQKEIAALLYAGPSSVITGQAAMAAHGINNLGRTVVDVLIPATSRRSDQSFVHMLRTSRMPSVVYKIGELRYVPVARAVADAARQLGDMRDVRSIVASAVQWRKVSVAELAAELEQGPTSGSARFRAALVEVADGDRIGCRGGPSKTDQAIRAARPGLQPAAVRGRGVHRYSRRVVAGRWRRGRGRFQAMASVAGRLGAHDGATFADERAGYHRLALSAESAARRAAAGGRRDQVRAGDRARQTATSDPDRVGALRVGGMHRRASGGRDAARAKGAARCGRWECGAAGGARASAAGGASQGSCPRP